LATEEFDRYVMNALATRKRRILTTSHQSVNIIDYFAEKLSNTDLFSCILKLFII